MIDQRIFKIENREGKERTIKSYVLRNNTLDEKGEKILENANKHIVYYDQGLKINSESLFGNDKPLIIEIGFGMGSATTKIAKERDAYNFLGLEVYLEGVIKTLKVVNDEKIENLKLMRYNAVDVLNTIVDDNSISGFHIFFPDPWMKKKHHKRRLINETFISLLASKLKEGGYIYFVTDWAEYADEALELFEADNNLVNPYSGFADPISWRPETKFERKGLEKSHEVREIWVEKKGRD